MAAKGVGSAERSSDAGGSFEHEERRCAVENVCEERKRRQEKEKTNKRATDLYDRQSGALTGV